MTFFHSFVVYYKNLTCGAVLDGVLGTSLRTTVLPAPPGCDSILAATWPLPLPPSGAGWVFCPGRTPCVALATGLTLAAGRALFMFVLPGATGSSRRLLLRCCICLETGVFWRKGWNINMSCCIYNQSDVDVFIHFNTFFTCYFFVYSGKMLTEYRN